MNNPSHNIWRRGIFFAIILLSFNATSYGNEYFRGHLVLGHEVRSFTPCEKKVKHWVLDQTGGDLWKVYQQLAHRPYQSIYVEVLGRLGPAPVDGFGADYDQQLTVLELRRAGLETRGCTDELGDIIFRASGNEPFWDAQISESRIVFSEMGKPQLSFPFAHPEVSDHRWVFFSRMKEPAQHDLQISITEKKCIDTMSGEHFSFASQVNLDDNQYVGCAREGLPRLRLENPVDTGKPEVYKGQTPTKSTLTMDVLKNAVYKSEFSAKGEVKLVDGLYKEKPAPESATELVITLSDKVAYGDLNGDGEEDAAVILITNSGGSGTFRHLAAVINHKGSPKNVASQFLGDRVGVQSVSIEPGKITVDLMTQAPNDPMCCPTLKVTRNYYLQDDKLVDVQVLGLLDKKWVLQSFGTEGSEEKPLTATEINIEFTADRRLHGSGGCNRYFSAYETGFGNSFTIKQIGSTRMACPQEIMDQEMRYFGSLQNVSTFKMGEQHLEFFDEKGNRVLNYSSSQTGNDQ